LTRQRAVVLVRAQLRKSVRAAGSDLDSLIQCTIVVPRNALARTEPVPLEAEPARELLDGKAGGARHSQDRPSGHPRQLVHVRVFARWSAPIKRLVGVSPN